MNRYTHMSDGYYAVSTDNYQCYEDQNEEMCGAAIDQLAAYEDIGMGPQELRDFYEEWKHVVELVGKCKQAGVGLTAEVWTPVSEERPNGECIAINAFNEYLIGHIIKYEASETGYICISEDSYMYDVTHWMLKPTPPKEGEL